MIIKTKTKGDKLDNIEAPKKIPINQNLPSEQTPTPPKWLKLLATGLIIIILIIAAVIVLTDYYRQAKNNKNQKPTENLAASSNQSTATNNEKAPSTTDVAGKDIANVPRYPDSVRTKYYQDPESSFADVVYRVETKRDQIFDYYQQALAKNNWKLASNTEETLTFTKNTSQVVINIPQTNKAIIQYEISYYPSPTK